MTGGSSRSWRGSLRSGKMLRKKRWDSPVGGAFVLFTVMLAAAPLAVDGILTRGNLAIRWTFCADPTRPRRSKRGLPRRARRTIPAGIACAWPELYFLKAAELGAAPERFANLLLVLSIAGSAAGAIRWRRRDGLAASAAVVPGCPFTPTPSPTVRCRSSFLCGGRTPGTTRAMAWRCCRYLRSPSHFWWRVERTGLRASSRRLFPGSLQRPHCSSSQEMQSLLRAKPLVLDEAIANSRTRIPFEVAYARALETLPENGTILAYTSEHVGAFQRAGVALKRTINESDYYRWTPALEDPAKAADFVIATDGDRVAQAVAARPDGLTLINIVCSTGQPCARFYRSDRRAGEW